jgi:hypothetical protein
MVEAMNDTQTTTNMKVNSSMEKLMERESTHGLMEKSMMGSGKEESKKAMESGKVSLETHTLESGRTVKQMGMVSTHGKMAIVMKVSGGIVLSMAKELISLQTKTLILDSTSLVSLMGLVSTNGRMAVPTLESSKMDSNMEKESGRKQEIKLIVIAMKESMSKTRKMGMEYSTGKVEISIKGTIKKMKEMGMVRCIGLMGLVIKEPGSRGFSMDKVKWYFQMAQSKKGYLKTTSSLELEQLASFHLQ